jgi:hypothetical protein
MRGLLADVNVQGHLEYLRRGLATLDLLTILSESRLELVTFADLNIPRDLNDRELWIRCQEDGWVLFTETRNDDGPDSLHAVLADSWREGHLPVLTLSNKVRFQHSREYAEQVASDVAELLVGILEEQYRDQPRIYVPIKSM